MKKCILMFTLLLLALVIAVLLENNSEVITNQGLQLSENQIEKPLFDYDKF